MKIMRTLVNFYQRYSAVLILLAVTLLAYGWQVNKLGFYWDDWVFVGRYQSMGLLNTIFYGGTRQLGVFAFMPGFLLASNSPLLWHIYSLLLRWVTALLFWWALNKLWPGQKTAVTLMAALFAVHPAFSQQSIAVVYSLQLVNYAIFLFSFGAMLKAERAAAAGGSGGGARRRWGWFGLAILAQGLHLFIVEYYVGLELIRPLALYLVQKQDGRGWRSQLQRVKSALLHWLPYLLVLGVYAVWRSGVLGGGFDTYEYKTITAFFHSDPRGAVLETLEYGLKDMLVLLVNTWNTALSPAVIDLSQPYNFFSLAVAAAAAGGLYFAISRPDFEPDQPVEVPAQEGEREQAHFLRQAVALGSLAVLVSFIPSWFVRRHIVEPGNFGDRFALAGLFGASILLVAATQFFGGRRGRATLLAALFIGLAIGAQMRFANTYRWDWERQLRTYWQVYWRAPALQPGTVLVGYDAISSTTVNYVGAFALNELYAPGRLADSPPMWFVNYPKTTIAANLDGFMSGNWVYVDQFDNISAPVRRDNSLGLDYSEGRCIRLLTVDDLANYDLAADFRPVAGFSNPGLIQAQDGTPPAARIFGKAPQAGWCYYFEKAELARQGADWDKVMALKKQADKAGLKALDAYELFPFIEAYAMRADWKTAEELSLEAFRTLPKTQAGVCLIWKRVGHSAPAGYEAAYSQLEAQLSCQ